MRLFIALALALFCAKSFADAPAKVLSESERPVYINAKRADFLAAKLESDLRRAGAKGGALCIVADGKIMLAKDFFVGAEIPQNQKAYPLGQSSVPLLSLAALNMESGGVLKADAPISNYCSIFRVSDGGKVSLADLLSMKAGFDAHADSLVPEDSSAKDVFDVAAQLSRAAPSDVERSKLQAALAGYVMAYAHSKKDSGLKKTFASGMDSFLFNPLGMDGVRYRGFDKPLFPAFAFALTIGDCAKWLEAELSARPAILSKELVAKRRNSDSVREKFSGGWLASNGPAGSFLMSGDRFENTANIVALFPDKSLGIAVFAVSDDSRAAPEICAGVLSEFMQLVAEPLNLK